MNRFLPLTLAALCCWSASAEIVYTDENPPPKKAFKDRTPEEQVAFRKYVADRRYRMTGGDIDTPGSNQGKILILDTQTRFAGSETTNVIASIYEMTKLPIAYEKGTAAEAADPAATLKNRKANVVVYILDDKTSPAMLVAPEDHWVKMNVGKLDKGLEGALAKNMFAQRCRKELIRSFTYACGGATSQFPNNVMAIGKLEDLDFVKEFVPVDMQMRYDKYLKEIGVTAKRTTTYANACKSGWAPAPTNDVQKAVWNRIHELPTKPITIEKK